MASLVRTPSQRGSRTSSWPRSQTLHHYQPPVRLDYRRRNSPSWKFLLLGQIIGEKKTKTNFDDTNQNLIGVTILKNLSQTKEYLLRRINQNTNEGKLLVITGPTGSGKSLLIKSLLGELPFSSDEINWRLDSSSYASQEAWLFPGTVAENIMFHRPLNEARYRRVVEVCALMPDFDELPKGDLTSVGDRGANLSGGQRARVNLARAIYRDADVYLIDDVLASVDVHVGKRIMSDCMKGYLKGKVRILVTHNPQHLREADEIIILKNGEVDFHGSYTSLIASGYRLPDLRPTESTAEGPPPEKTKDSSAQNELELTFGEKNAEQSINAAETNRLVANAKNGDHASCKYFSAGGSTFTLLCLGLSFVVAQASVSGCDYWLAKWMTQNRVYKDVNSLGMESSLYLFGGLTLSSIVMWTASSILFYKVCVTASRNLHNQMFSSLFKTPMRFFQLNSSGRILNRFSKDTGLVDETLPTVTLDAAQGFLMMVAVAIQLAVSSWRPSLMFTTITVFAVGIQLTNYYLPNARDFKRKECTAKSAVFSHTQSTIAGLTTIRSAGNQQAMKEKFDSLQVTHFCINFCNTVFSSVYGFSIDVLFILLLVAVTVLLLLSNGRTGLEALTITQTLMLYGKIQYGLRQTAEMLVQMVSVERIFQLIDLKSEGPFEKASPMLKEWPSEGKIEFKHVCLKYSTDEAPVLKDISFTINPKEKIGIVGRTGAGKTSLITALLRLTEADGSIFIDDVDTKTVGLHDLRRAISVIPQEPMLFTTTLRNNLDPVRVYSDEVLWKALEDVELRDRFDTLDYPIESGGNNLSGGEKQLLCLARAVVAGNKIVVLDEATANVDSKTEQIIQKTINRLFYDCTVITIAHRLNTVFKSDRILVVDQGKVVEFDSPSSLMQQKDGFFFKMVNA